MSQDTYTSGLVMHNILHTPGLQETSIMILPDSLKAHVKGGTGQASNLDTYLAQLTYTQSIC